ncbi:hypothetical protein C882_0589 [Caenispirillum salinarum AK4]|uniref:Integral membrane protein n=1 Tax=Caenispirillum salinarum AK4 TaxID=1238182 RepID=K9GVP3_9PROT|nr:DUF2270 domain-containing protein [Caenispirillum salinarum]EKV29282.1 hypothetical protein C882_0589 [Caenispirillum salinarum AK4]
MATATTKTRDQDGSSTFSGPELGAIAHLYRGEVYRSTIWRSRLDNTTNWAVLTTGVALSIAFASPQASALPLILVGLLVAAFLAFEARRYRYFNVWRARCRLMETDIYAPMLRGEGVTLDGRWNTLLSSDYLRPHFHISYGRALGRRLRKNYAYILTVQAVAYAGKLSVHPTALDSWAALLDRAAVGPVPGLAVLGGGLLFHGAWITLALVTLRIEKRYRRSGALIAIA